MGLFKRLEIRLVKIVAIVFAILVFLIAGVYVFALFQKENILKKVTATINQNISGNVFIGDIDFTLFEKFPALSIRLKNVSIVDSLVNYHKDTLFKAQSMAFQIKILKLITGDVSFGSFILTNAKVSILKTANGFSNAQLIRPTKSTFSGEKKKDGESVPRLQKIILNNVSFNMRDSMKMKFFSFKFKNASVTMDQLDSVISINMEGKMHFDYLIFNVVKGGYLTDKDVDINLVANFNLASSSLTIEKGNLEVDRQKLLVNGKFLFSGSSSMKLHFESNEILPSVAFSMLPNFIGKKLSVYELQNAVMVSVFVNGPIAAGSKPVVDVYFKSTDNTLSFAGRTFENLNVLGYFMNHVDSTKINDDHNSRVYLPVFSSYFNGVLPLKAALIVTDLLEPRLFMVADVNLNQDNEVVNLNTEKFRVMSGIANVHFNFNGPLVDYVDTINYKLIADIAGNVFIKNLSFDFIPTGYEFRNVSGSFDFDENDLNVDSLYLELNKSSAFIKGNIKQFISVLFVPKVKAVAILDVQAGTLDFNGLKKTTVSNAGRTTVEDKNQTSKKKPGLNKIASTIGIIISKIELDLNLSAQKVIVNRFVATDLTSNLSVTSDQINFSNTSMNIGGGSFKLNGGVEQLNQAIRTINIASVINNVDISTMMYAFNDFDQKGITSKQISGKLSAQINFKANSKNLKIDQNSMVGTMNISIKKGELRNIEGFKEIQKYIFKNRDFNNIQFAEIKNRFAINETMIDISKLELYSSVMTLFVDGKYDLKKINTNMTIQVPFSNLEKKDAKERLDKSDSTLITGGSLYFRATNKDDGKIQVSPILIRKKADKNRDANNQNKKSNASSSDSSSNNIKKKHP
ncbi:MAG: hypothetical protein LH473_05730 [Chitinophagales bacterium]|nr:hypothetical protein [Chitinophagales bacterium]